MVAAEQGWHYLGHRIRNALLLRTVADPRRERADRQVPSHPPGRKHRQQPGRSSGLVNVRLPIIEPRPYRERMPSAATSSLRKRALR
jgi:hypothetical protein